MFQLRDYQQETLDAVKYGHQEHASIAVELATGLGKAQPDSEPVLTPRGWKKMGDIAPGDMVIGGNGKQVEVESIHPQGTKDIFCVIMSDGTSTRCTGDHLWSVRTKHDNVRRKPWRTITLKEIRDSQIEWFCPVVKPIQFNQGTFFETPVNPYLLGVLLGDGHLKENGVLVSSDDKFIVDQVSDIVGKECGLHLRYAGQYDYAITHGIPKKRNALLAQLRGLGLAGKRSHEKYIPKPYLFSSIEDRLALLQGLMDTDGCLQPGCTSGEFTSASIDLAHGVAFLVRSLGGVTRIRRKKINGYRDAFRVTVSPAKGMNPFRLPRKADQYRQKTKYEPVRKIIGVESCGYEKSTCIKVANKDGLYVTNGLIVTHNTVLFTKYAAAFQEHYGQRSMVIAPQITLIGQAAKKIFKETGVMPAIEQATNYSNEEDWGKSPFVVASKQTLTSNDRYKRFTDIGLVVIDECHYAATKIYSDLIDHFRDNGAMVLGVSATLKRHDKRAIGQIFDQCVYQYGICDAITDGWLAPIKVTCKQLEKLDLSGVQTVNSFFGKDFNLQQLNEKLENPEVIYEICEAVAAETAGQKTAIFCSSVTEAQAVAELLQDKYHMSADWICADTRKCSPSKREETMNSFHHPDGITHLANVGILTTGWDYPALMNLVMARPTKSLPLYTQIFGRLTRPWEEDGHTAVDFEGSTPDLRRQAIAASKKPFGRMIDLVDVSLKHKIVTGGDVLGGKWTLDDDQLTCRFCLQRFPSMVAMTVHLWQAHEEEMLKAQQKSQEEHEQETDELNIRLRQQRAAVRAKALFHDVDVNPFEGGRRARAREVKQREMATTKQKRYMWVLGFKDIDDYSVTKHQAMRMIGQLKNGAGLEEVKRQNRLVRK